MGLFQKSIKILDLRESSNHAHLNIPKNCSHPENPLVLVIHEESLSDLDESRQQISDGESLDMEDALERIGKQHGFI